MEAYIGTIIAWAPNYAPEGWAFCNGQLLAISSNQVLYSLLGTTYGGDGRTNFALPNLNGRVPVGAVLDGGMGGNLPPGVTTQYALGEGGGQENVTLSSQNMPQHTHGATSSTSGLTVSGLNVQIPAASGAGNSYTPSPQASLAQAVDSAGDQTNLYTTGNTDTYLKPAVVSVGSVSGTVTTTISPSGLSQPEAFEIMQPYQALNYIICVQGIYPTRP